MPSFDGYDMRDTSGLGGSILVTSAPRSASVRAHNGPASTREKSTTLMPCSGPDMSAPLELGQAGAVGLDRREAGLQVLRGPDRLLHFGHGLVGGCDTLVDRNLHELLRGHMRDRRPRGQLLSDRHRGCIELLVGHDQVDEAP